MFLLAPGGAWGLKAGGGQISVTSLFQDPWGQVTFDANLSRGFLCGQAAHTHRQVVRAPAGSLLRAIFFCFALIFSILAIEDKQRKPFSSPPVKTPLPFCQFLCLPFPLILRQGKRWPESGCQVPCH